MIAVKDSVRKKLALFIVIIFTIFTSLIVVQTVYSSHTSALTNKKQAQESMMQIVAARDSIRVGPGQDDIKLNPIKNVGVKDPNSSTMDKVVNIVFSLAGGLALLFVVMGGTRYILSRGDPQAAAQARNTILYAVVGLIVTILAFSIVKFVMKSLF